MVMKIDGNGQLAEGAQEHFATLEVGADPNFLAVVDKLCETQRQLGTEAELRKRIDFLEEHWSAPDDIDDLHDKIEELTQVLNEQAANLHAANVALENGAATIRRLHEEKGELIGKLALQGKASTAPIPLEVGQTIFIEKAGGGTRKWEIVAIFLGGTRQEDVAEVVAHDRQQSDQGPQLVPLDLIRAAMRGGSGEKVLTEGAENTEGEGQADDVVAGQEAEVSA